MSDNEVVTGPPCPECGRDLRWVKTPVGSGSDPDRYKLVPGCTVCVEPVA